MTAARRSAVAIRMAWQAGQLTASLCLAVAVVTGLAPAATAWSTKLVIDALTRPGAGWSRLAGPAIALAGTGLAAAALPHVSRYTEAELRRAVSAFMQDRLFAAINAFQGIVRFEDPRFHDRLRLAQQGGQSAPQQLITAAFAAVQASITLGGFLAALFVLSPPMAVLVPLSGLPAVYAQLVLSRRRAGFLWTSSPATRRRLFYASLQSDPVAAKEVRLFGLGDWLRRRMIGELRAINGAERELDRGVLRAQGLLGLTGAAIAGGGLLWAVGQAMAGHLTIGGVSVFVAAVAGTQSALAVLVGGFADSHQSLLLFGHYLDMVDDGPDLPAPAETRALPPLTHGIELRDVWFRYDDDGPWVLRGVDLFVPYGKAVALVGLNGAGKSTLVKLLCRLYDPTKGAIRWDGVDIRDVPVAELRDRMGAVFQDHMRYDLSATENIGIGDLAALDEPGRVRGAARLAGIDARIAELPRGYDTLLSRVFYAGDDLDDPESGVSLSGGQWQRVALARALMRQDRDLLILDEPSSGLDAEAEHAVHLRLRDHRAGRTSLLISHRLGAVREADVIVVLADGRIIEEGGHAELMAARGEYARLFDLQASGYQADAAEAARPA